MNLLKQSRIKAPWIGAIQVQVGSSMFYVNAFIALSTATTLWYTSAYRIQRFPPLEWVNIWVFLAIVLAGFVLVMYIDYRFILPVRQAFINKQSFKHENEAIEAIREMQARLNRIEEKLNEQKASKV